MTAVNSCQLFHTVLAFRLWLQQIDSDCFSYFVRCLNCRELWLSSLIHQIQTSIFLLTLIRSLKLPCLCKRMVNPRSCACDHHAIKSCELRVILLLTLAMINFKPIVCMKTKIAWVHPTSLFSVICLSGLLLRHVLVFVINIAWHWHVLHG